MSASRIFRELSGSGWFVALLVFLVGTSSWAETPYHDLESRLNEALEDNAGKVNGEKKIANTIDLFSKRLAAVREEYKNQGNLDAVLEVERVITLLESGARMSGESSSISKITEYQNIYAREIEKIDSEEIQGVLFFFKRYGESLFEREQKLVREGAIDQAVKVREERVRVKEMIDKLSAQEMDSMTSEYFPSFRELKKRSDNFGENSSVAGFSRDPATAATNSSVEPLRELKAQFERTLAEHRVKLGSAEKSIYEKYMKELRVREYHYQTQGSLDGVLAIRGAMERLKDEGALLRENTELKHLLVVRKEFDEEINNLKSASQGRFLSIYRQYLDACGEIERSLVKQDAIDKAILVRKEREKIADLMEERSEADLELHLFEVFQVE